MTDYTYLLLGLYFLALAAVIFLFRRDLRTRMLRLGFLGVFLGPLSEVWYWEDYWQPPSVLHVGRYALEDVIVGIAVAALAGVLYEAISGKQSDAHTERRRGSFISLFLFCLAALIVFGNLLHFNSGLVSSVLFFFAAFFMIMHRRDLFLPSLVSGLLLVAIAAPIYFVLFELIDPAFWREHWLLFGTQFGWILGDALPLTAMLWYMGWGMMAGIATHYANGTAPVKPSQNGLQMFGRMLKRGLGILCIIVGFGALVTPFTPGAWLILVGLELLGLSFLIPEKYRKQFREWRYKVLGR